MKRRIRRSDRNLSGARRPSPEPTLYEEATRLEGRINDLPVNHSPKFAPVLHPTLATGVEAMVVAAMGWLQS